MENSFAAVWCTALLVSMSCSRGSQNANGPRAPSGSIEMKEQPPSRPNDHSEAVVRACLNGGAEEESGSLLWRQLADWAFDHVPEIPNSRDITKEQQASLIAELEVQFPDLLKTPDDWQSAGRYFQAENFHALERPACMKGAVLELEHRNSPGIE